MGVPRNLGSSCHRELQSIGEGCTGGSGLPYVWDISERSSPQLISSLRGEDKDVSGDSLHSEAAAPE